MDIILTAKACRQIRNKADTSGWPQGRKQLIMLYSFGLEIKLEQAKYALERVAHFTRPEHSKPLARRRLEFYSDQCWCVLWSVLDIMGNLINVTEGIGMAESDVYLSSVAPQLSATQAGSLVARRVSKLRSSQHFDVLRDYRRCATHRRHVCIISAKIEAGLGYGDSVATSAVEKTLWYLCDDPLSLGDANVEQRVLPDFMEVTTENLLKDIKGVLTAVRAAI